MAAYTSEFKKRIETQQQRSITPSELQRLFDLENKKTLETGGLTPVKNLEAPPEKTLPESSGSSLTDFAGIMEDVNRLARQKRGESLKGILGKDIEAGAVSPATFGSLLSSFESASSKAADVITKKVFPEEEAKGDLGEYLQAKKLGVVPQDMEYFDYLAKKKRSTDSPLSSLADTLGVADRDIAKGLAASGKSADDFAKLPEAKQRDFIFGAGSRLEGGKVPRQDILTIKSNILDQLKPDKEGNVKTREQLEDMIDDLQLPAADKLELLLYLDEISPIPEPGFFERIKEGFTGVTGL